MKDTKQINNEVKAEILEYAPVLIAFHDVRHHIIWANKAYRKATNSCLEELSAKKCYYSWGLEHPCSGCPVIEALETGKPAEAELTPESQENWPVTQGSWLSKAVPILGADGRIIGALEAAFDITKRKQAEKEAMEASEKACRLEMLEVLYRSLEQKNLELVQAHDATIEGWARALALKEEETEEHSKRVISLTLKIAGTMGIRGEDLTHLRRGCLLHDIGKIGIPDCILLKPGRLTDSEWEVMKRHPEHAFQMLSRIIYLRSAIDIPYCHHERWDGTGYPRGLKGSQIPLSARIFAVVDVWDALTRDRPYRGAWPPDKALKYILDRSGTHFDPAVVQVFLSLIRKFTRLKTGS